MKEKVSHLYNKLFEFERRARKLKSYPIHKKLKLPGHLDIYDLLIQEFDLNYDSNILDAGCGVGYGSLKMAEKTQAKVLGISVSPLEIDQSKQNLSLLQDVNCKFQVMSFEEVSENKFDTIICVESLKHAIPIESAVQALIRSLKIGGRLIVVDDFYQKGSDLGKVEQAFIQDWRLEKLIELTDLPAGKVKDLTQYMEIKPLLTSRLKLILLTIIRPFVSTIYVDIFRGGVHLDILYRKNSMKYMVYAFKKTE